MVLLCIFNSVVMIGGLVVFIAWLVVVVGGFLLGLVGFGWFWVVVVFR